MNWLHRNSDILWALGLFFIAALVREWVNWRNEIRCAKFIRDVLM